MRSWNLCPRIQTWGCGSLPWRQITLLGGWRTPPPNLGAPEVIHLLISFTNFKQSLFEEHWNQKVCGWMKNIHIHIPYTHIKAKCGVWLACDHKGLKPGCPLISPWTQMRRHLCVWVWVFLTVWVSMWKYVHVWVWSECVNMWVCMKVCVRVRDVSDLWEKRMDLVFPAP